MIAVDAKEEKAEIKASPSGASKEEPKQQSLPEPLKKEEKNKQEETSNKQAGK